MSMLIRNGEIVTADSRYKADILVENQKIARIGTGIEAPADADVIGRPG